MRNALVSSVMLLTSCGPLSGMSKVADRELLILEACCEDMLKRDVDVSRCDSAFEAHDHFVDDWTLARNTGLEYHYQKALNSLELFLKEAEEVTCEQH